MAAAKTRPVAERYGLAELLGELSERHGDKVAQKASELDRHTHLPTGIFTLDMALLGGIPEGSISMLYGWESSGKTTIAIKLMVSAQRKYPDKEVVFVDSEGHFDTVWAAKHGLDLERCRIIRPASGEQAVDICCALVKAYDVSLIIQDSLPALLPIKMQENSAEDNTVALRARLIDYFVTKSNQAILDERHLGHWPSLVLINQFRNKIALMGDNRSLPGGNAVKFFVGTRIELKNSESIGRDAHDVEVVDVNTHSFKITKNKFGNSIRTGEFEMVRNPSHKLGEGFIDDAKTVLTYAKKFGLFTGGGSTWRIDGLDEKFNKIQEAVDYLYSDLEFFERLKFRLISIQRDHSGLDPKNWYLPAYDQADHR